MKAMVIEAFGGPEKLHLKTMPKPEPLMGEVLIQNFYAGVNPVDWKIREGFKKSIPYQFPIILGWDAAGIIVETGEEVFAYTKKPMIKWGTYAEYVTCEAQYVVRKPKNISFAQAAALPTISLTAWQSLFDAAKLKKGERVLIQGASGGVGSMAVQFAKNAGAYVIGTASPPKHEHVKNLGADEVLDYRSNFTMKLKESMDVAFDAAGGDAFFNSIACLKKGGRVVSILEQMSPQEAQQREIEAYYVFVAPNGEQLKTIAELIEDNKVLPPPVKEMPLEEAAEAQEKVRSGQVFGKIVLKI